MYFDEVVIELTGGKGGDGMIHFLREKYVPRGGPDGEMAGMVAVSFSKLILIRTHSQISVIKNNFGPKMAPGEKVKIKPALPGMI